MTEAQSSRKVKDHHYISHTVFESYREAAHLVLYSSACYGNCFLKLSPTDDAVIVIEPHVAD